MIVRFFIEGGPSFMTPVYLMWISVFILVIRYIVLYRLDKNHQKLKRTNDSILFIGSFTFLVGITGQMVGLLAAFDAIQKVSGTGIDPHLLVGGLKCIS